jgi:hypothetical protein
VSVVPAVVLLSACGSDSTTSPKSVVASDTVAVDEGSAIVIENYTNSSGTHWESFSAGNDGDYAETYNNSATNLGEYRELVQFPLPALAGKGVVDSANVYEYVCRNSGNTGADSLLVDHVNWGAHLTDSLSFNGQTLTSAAAVLVADTTHGWHGASVTASVQADYTGKRQNSQYRLRFSSLATSGQDYWLEFAGSYCYNSSASEAGAGPAYLVIWAH